MVASRRGELPVAPVNARRVPMLGPSRNLDKRIMVLIAASVPESDDSGGVRIQYNAQGGGRQ